MQHTTITQPYCPHANVPASQCVACNANASLIEAAERLDLAYAGSGFHGMLVALDAIIALLPGGERRES